MLRTPQEQLRTLFPQFGDHELPEAYERLRRYVALAVEIARQEASTTLLTESPAGGSVNAGQVEPPTFKNTG